jgi:hypothetical protein
VDQNKTGDNRVRVVGRGEAVEGEVVKGEAVEGKRLKGRCLTHQGVDGSSQQGVHGKITVMSYSRVS